MSISALVSYKFLNHSHYSSRNGHKIERITIHHAAGPIGLDGLKWCCANRECSYNYGISVDGKVGLFVDEKYSAWTSCSQENDSRAVTIEVANAPKAGEPDWKVSDTVYKVLITLVTDICRRNGIKRLTYTGKLQGSNLTMHQWFAPTGCPGPYLKSKFPDIAAKVNKNLGSGSSALDGLMAGLAIGNELTSYDYAMMGTVEQSQALVDTSKIYPYIATIDRNTTKIDYTALKKLGVRGVVFEAGRLYDAIYQEMRYMNMNLDKQIEDIQKANLPYGLYADVRARNEKEARRELYYLSLVVRSHPPQIGLWLQLNFIKEPATNNRIIDVYYETMLKLGLKDQCGFYVTKSQLKKIDWKKYQDKWYLWLDDHVKTVGDIPSLLTPEFFVVR